MCTWQSLLLVVKWGGGYVKIIDAVEMLNRIDTVGITKSLLVKLIRVSGLSVLNMCRGLNCWSNGLRFCVKFKCMAVSHQHQKVESKTDIERYYIVGGRGSQAYTKP